MSNKQSVKRKRAWVSILCAFSLVFSFFPFAYAGADESTASDDELSAALIASPSAAPSLRSASGSVGAMTVELSNAEGGWDDVSTFTSGASWSAEDLRTLRISYDFLAGTDKTITVDVPKGYQIVGYSATDDTADLDGVDKITIDPQYIADFQSSTLKATDGTSAWEAQVVSGYTAKQSTTETDQRVYAGKAFYSLANSATTGTIVLTLKPQINLMKHTAEEEDLGTITVAMSSSAGSVSDSFYAHVTEVAVPYIQWPGATWGRQYSNAVVDDATGLSESFGVQFYQSSYWFHEQQYLSDQVIVEIEYPAGVYFDNRTVSNYFGIWGTVSGTGELLPNHCTVTDTGNVNTGGSVVMELDKTTFYDGGWRCDIGAYFVADTTTGLVSPGDTLAFPITIKNINQGDEWSYSATSYRTLLDNDKFYMGVWSKNTSRWDITADYPNFDKPYVMGGFVLDAYTSYSDIPLHFDYSDLPGVCGMFLPGYNVRDISVVSTMGNTYTVASIPGVGSSHGGVYLSPETIGLLEGEYIQTLDCTVDLEQMTYGMGHIYSFTYFGDFIDGQEGDAVFSVLDENGSIAVNGDGTLLTTTDHTTIAHNWTASGYGETTVTGYGADDATFYPNDTIYFQSYIMGGYDWADSTTIIDPIIMISLPKGINLDTSSVKANSTALQATDDRTDLVQIKTPRTETIDGVEWTTYYFTSANPMDMVAYERGVNSETLIEVFFEAHVAANSPEYGQVSLADCVQWDVGESAAPWTAYRELDTYNRAGKGTDYYIYETGGNFTVKPLIGLNIDLGIRVKDSGTGFYTYNATENSIAALSKSNNAEVRIAYKNTGSSDYLAGSVIYLPIPKLGNNYSKYFQNIELGDPLNTVNNKTFEFNTNLATTVSLDGFTTYYSVDAAENSEAYDPSSNAGTWEPVTGTWYTYDELLAAGKNLADVTMLKLVSQSSITPSETAHGVFELAIDNSARIGQLDYWRAYSKGVTDGATGAGTWSHSSVLAATPGSNGLMGQVFVDYNYDGFFDTAAGDSAYADGHVTAILSRDDGTMANLELAINDDGTFRSLNDNGTVYQLRPGDYTVTLEEADDAFMFSPYSGSLRSSDAGWYNDLRPENISETTAIYHFTVDETNELGCYVGIGLTDYIESISIDVPITVNIALNADGTWCTPTALDNKIINLSNCAMRVASASATAKTGFTLTDTSALDANRAVNVFAGTLAAGTGAAQDLSAIDTTGAEWAMADGSATDGSNQIPLQLAGAIKNVEGHYFTAPINVFDITFTFEHVS